MNNLFPDDEYIVSYVYQGRYSHRHRMTTILNDNPMNFIKVMNDNCLFDDGEYILLNFWKLEEDNG